MRRKEERCKQGQTNNKAKQHSTPKAVTFPKKNELPRVGLEPTILYTQTCTCTAHVPRWNGSREYSGDITRELRPVFTREIAFQRQNSLKFARELARNSFSRFEGVNHSHTPGLA